jgi:HK97 family phage major capsid protein
MNQTEMYKKKADLKYQLDLKLQKATDEKRALNAEELAALEAGFTEIENIQKTIDASIKLSQIEADKNEPFLDPKGNPTGMKKGDVSNERAIAMDKWIRKGAKALDQKEISLLGVKKDKDDEGRVGTSIPTNIRATNSVVLNPTYVQDIELSRIFTETKNAYGGWLEQVTEVNTDSGRTLYMPYTDDAGNIGTIEAYGTDIVASSTDVTLARQQLDSYPMSSQGIKVDWDDLEDSSLDMNEWLMRPLMTRLLRVVSYYATLGTGSSQPLGIVNGSKRAELYQKGVTPTQTDLNNLLKAVNYAYHQGKNSGWMFNSTTMFDLMAVVQSTTYNNSPLWAPGLSAAAPSTLLGKKYTINNQMASKGTGTICMLFGDFSYFVQRYVGSPKLIRLDERYAELGQVAFFYIWRTDSEYKIPKTSTYYPVGHLVSIAT